MFDGRIFVCADIHGSATAIRNIINQIESPQKNDIIIVAGDAGFEYDTSIMGSAKKAAKKFPGTFIVMRGNHDSSYWYEHTENQSDEDVKARDGWTVENGFLYQNKYPNIWYVYDNGGIYSIGDYNFLFLPGAYSIDKDYRLRRGFPYNKNEQLDYSVMCELIDLVKSWNDNGFPIDFVIGHTFPRKLEPLYNYLFLSNFDQSNVDHRTEQWLDQMADLFEVNPDFKQYFGGHFHDTKSLNDKYTMVYQIPINVKKWIGE